LPPFWVHRLCFYPIWSVFSINQSHLPPPISEISQHFCSYTVLTAVMILDPFSLFWGKVNSCMSSLPKAAAMLDKCLDLFWLTSCPTQKGLEWFIKPVL
jgi:hypothetical protein